MQKLPSINVTVEATKLGETKAAIRWRILERGEGFLPKSITHIKEELENGNKMIEIPDWAFKNFGKPKVREVTTVSTENYSSKDEIIALLEEAITKLKA